MYSIYTGSTGTVLLLLSMSRVLAAFNLFRAFMDLDLSLLCSVLSRFVSNEKGNHSKPTWVGSEQKGSLTVAGKTFPIALKRDSEAINPSLFFFKSITSTVGEIEFNKPGTYTLHLKGIKIGAGKWQDGLGLDRVDLIPVK